MAGFSSLGLGLLLGAIGGGAAATVAGRRKNQAPTPGADDATALTPAQAPAAPDTNRAASDGVAAGRQASVRVRRRAGSGAAQGPRARTPGRAIGRATAQVEPRTLLGY